MLRNENKATTYLQPSKGETASLWLAWRVDICTDPRHP